MQIVINAQFFVFLHIFCLKLSQYWQSWNIYLLNSRNMLKNLQIFKKKPTKFEAINSTNIHPTIYHLHKRCWVFLHFFIILSTLVLFCLRCNLIFWGGRYSTKWINHLANLIHIFYEKHVIFFLTWIWTWSDLIPPIKCQCMSVSTRQMDGLIHKWGKN